MLTNCRAKPTMQVYFARSIRGQHAAGEKIFFKLIADTIKKRGHVLAMETPVDRSLYAHLDENSFIYERDIEWLDNSQAMIAEVSNPSLGVGFELCYALWQLKIPILAVASKDTNVSAMVAGSLDVFFYRDRSDLEAQIEAFLEESELIQSR